MSWQIEQGMCMFGLVIGAGKRYVPTHLNTKYPPSVKPPGEMVYNMQYYIYIETPKQKGANISGGHLVNT